jgi:hypothetical protein
MNMPKKKKKSKKSMKPKHNKQSMLHALNSHLPSAAITKGNSDNKLSEVILQFCRPLLNNCPTLEEEEKLLNVAIISWNLGILPDEEAAKLKENMKAGLLPGDTDASKDMEEIIAYLVARKKREFASDLRIILNYNITTKGDNLHLDVAYSQ